MLFGNLHFVGYNISGINFSSSFNSNVDNLDNTNASRHFAEEPFSTYSKINNNVTLILLIFAAIFIACVCTGLVLAMLIYSSDGRLIRRNQNGDVVRMARPDLLTLYRETIGEAGLHQYSDETHTIETPSSIYPGDMLPSFSDSSGKEKLFSDTITTPLSNNSIITMTMRNNHLIVETEERIPISCSMLNTGELYSSLMDEHPNAFVSPDMEEEYQSNDMDDMECYAQDQSHTAHICSLRPTEERRTFYEATTSRQADEEDQHIELFHKNILVLPSCERPKLDAVPCCSYGLYGEEQPQCGGGGGGGGVRPDGGTPSNTGLTQSDPTGSSSSTSRHVQNNYNYYGNQCEYVLPGFPLRKHLSSFRLANRRESTGFMVAAHSSPYLNRQNTPEDSVLQLTDCSSSEFSEPSK